MASFFGNSTKVKIMGGTFNGQQANLGQTSSSSPDIHGIPDGGTWYGGTISRSGDAITVTGVNIPMLTTIPSLRNVTFEEGFVNTACTLGPEGNFKKTQLSPGVNIGDNSKFNEMSIPPGVNIGDNAEFYKVKIAPGISIGTGAKERQEAPQQSNTGNNTTLDINNSIVSKGTDGTLFVGQEETEKQYTVSVKTVEDVLLPRQKELLKNILDSAKEGEVICRIRSMTAMIDKDKTISGIKNATVYGLSGQDSGRTLSPRGR
jgi:hypothetical protein